MNEPTQRETEELTQVWKALLSPSNDSPLVDQPTEAIPKLARIGIPRKIILIPLDPPKWML